jgi:hypothetical protein
MMQQFSVLRAAGLAMLLAAAPVAAQSADDSWDGLVAVNARQLDAAFLSPGSDFRPYTRVMVEEPEVAFRPNWVRDQNRARSAGRRVSDSDVARIKDTVSASTIDSFARAFSDAGFEVVTRAGPDVLKLRTAIVNLSINAPDTRSAGRVTTFTTNAGEATLVLEVRDSDTNALLARVVDRREARDIPGRANSVTNTAEFRSIASHWARIAAKRLNTLQEISPVPDPLTPGQRLP